MAVYDPTQPRWKRYIAGLLDSLLAILGFGFLLGQIFGFEHSQIVTANGTAQGFGLGTVPSLLLLLSVFAYFYGMGKTGGTIFQRLFGLKRIN